jgi:surface antigen
LGSQIGAGSGKTAAIIGGALLGALVGGAIGADMDEQDRLRTQQILETYPDASPSSWRNPNNGYTYKVTPLYTYETAQGPCRDYETEAYIDGRRQSVRGSACREPDGTWRATQ